MTRPMGTWPGGSCSWISAFQIPVPLLMHACIRNAGLDAYISLLQRCWAQALTDRPTFHQVVHELGLMEGML
jgi:hypothetical protein